ncbi:hypothetical protein BGZ76_007536, partial [Entomortierella beljakovae]
MLLTDDVANRMKTFKDYVMDDTHGHIGFDKQYTCFTSYIGRQRLRGDEEALNFTIDINMLRK